MSAMSAEELFARGYVPLSNRYRVVARIDRADWLQVLAKAHNRSVADFYVHSLVGPPKRAGQSFELGNNTGRWGQFYCSVHSKDKIEGIEFDVYTQLKKLWAYEVVVTYVPSPDDKVTSVSPWTLEAPTEPGWYWLKVPEDYPRTALRDVPPALVHLHVRHGLHYYEGRLSGEVPGHWGFTRDPMDVTTMRKIGIKFHGPIRAPE